MTFFLFTLAFWRAAGERAAKTAAQVVLTAYFGGDVLFNIWTADWASLGGLALGGAFFSVLTSIATAATTDGGPSLGNVEKLPG